MTPPKNDQNQTTYAHRFAANLRELRKTAGLSQSELSQRLGVMQSTVSFWERAERLPPLNQMPAIAKALGDVPAEKFFPDF